MGEGEGGGGEAEQITKVGNKSEKAAGTTERKPVFEGNKGTRTLPGRPSTQDDSGSALQSLFSYWTACTAYIFQQLC